MADKVHIDQRALAEEAELLGRDLDVEVHDLDKLEPPQDASTATRYGWALAYAEAELNELNQWYDEEVERVRERQADVTAGLRAKVEAFEKVLRDYHRAVRSDDERRKTIGLPSVTLNSRAGSTRLVLPERESPEMAELVKWCRANRDGFVEAVVEPPCPQPYVDNATLRKLLTRKSGSKSVLRPVTADGEAVPHVSVETGDTSYWVVPEDVKRRG